jgi:hypothetical protein
MTENKMNHCETGRSVTQNQKKAYVKPAFEFERVFETMALSCGKIHANIWACKAVRKNS